MCTYVHTYIGYMIGQWLYEVTMDLPYKTIILLLLINFMYVHTHKHTHTHVFMCNT